MSFFKDIFEEVKRKSSSTSKRSIRVMRTNADTHYGNGKKATRHNLRADRRSGEEFFAAKNPLDCCRGSDCDPQSFEGSLALFPRPWSLPYPISLYEVLTRPWPTRPCAANGPATSKVCNKKNGRGSCNWGAPGDEMNPVDLDRADPAYDSCGTCQCQCASQPRIPVGRSWESLGGQSVFCGGCCG